jgi:peptide/nickel transport system permease protein
MTVGVVSVASHRSRPQLAGALSNSSIRRGLTILILLIVAAIVAQIALGDPLTQDLGSAYVAPFKKGHWLGTDGLGRDILAWVMGGILTGLQVSAGVVALSATVGTVIGLISGYSGRVVDAVLMRLTDFQLAIPPLPLFIAASAVVTGSMPVVIILISVVSWVPYSRLVRARVLVERERAYVSAARLAGTRSWRILLVHLLPAAATEITVVASLQAGTALLVESGLSFLGLGLQPPYKSLGFMIAAGRENLVQAWWVTTFPGIAIVLLVLAFNLIGDGIRDAMHSDVEVLAR